MPTKKLPNDTEKVSIDSVGAEATRIKIAHDLKRFNNKVIVLESSDLDFSRDYSYPLLDESDPKLYALVTQDKNNEYRYHLLPLQTKETSSSCSNTISLDTDRLIDANLCIRLASQNELKATKTVMQENKAEFSGSGMSSAEINGLFKKEIKGEFQLRVYPETLPPYDIAMLISKNRSVPEILDKLTPDMLDIVKLQRAIQEADFSSTIWNNENCNVYLLYLMNQQLISFNEGITAYMYLIALMQLTSNQELRAEAEVKAEAKAEMKVKRNYTVLMEPMVANGKLTELGTCYAKYIFDYCSGLRRAIDAKHVENCILTLPPIEQQLICSEYDSERAHKSDIQYRDSEIEVFLYALINSTPVMEVPEGITKLQRSSPTAVEYAVPSFSIIQFILSKLNTEPVMLVPIPGDIGGHTLYQWHEAGFHPFPLYMPQIWSNPKPEVDGYLSGPWPGLIHDIYHAQGMNLLSTKEKQCLFDKFIPLVGLLEELLVPKLTFLGDAAKNVKNYCNAIIERLYDFNLQKPREHYIDQERFNRYLIYSFSVLSGLPSLDLDSNMVYFIENQKGVCISSVLGDYLYFGLQLIRNDNKYAEYKETALHILNSVDNDTAQLRDPEVLLALRTVAENFVKDPNKLIADPNTLTSCKEVDWLEWLGLAYLSDNSEELWGSVIGYSTRAKELLIMMSKGFTFLHPLVPMTEEKRNEFKEFLFTALGKDKITNRNLLIYCCKRATGNSLENILKDLKTYKIDDSDSMKLRALCKIIEQQVLNDTDYRIVELLLAHCVDLNAKYDNNTALYVAAWHGHQDIVTLLLNQPSCKVDTCCSWGETALFKAAQCSHLGIVTQLLRSGADPCVESRYYSPGRGKLLNILIDKIDGIASNEDSALKKRQVEIAKLLIDAMLKKLNIPKPDILKRNKALSKYWDNSSEKLNDKRSHSSDFFPTVKSSDLTAAEAIKNQSAPKQARLGGCIIQ